MQFDEPAQAADATQHMLESLSIELTSVLRIESEAHATGTRSVQRLAALRTRAAVEPYHGEVAPSGAGDRIQIDRVVEAVRVRVHDEATRNAERIMQRERAGERGVGRRVLALRRVRETRLRPKHVKMRIPGTFRQADARPRRSRQRPEAIANHALTPRIPAS